MLFYQCHNGVDGVSGANVALNVTVVCGKEAESVTIRATLHLHVQALVQLWTHVI